MSTHNHNQTRQKRLDTLKRRRDYLKEQIEARSFDKKPRHYEKREVEALEWAIETLGALVELHRTRNYQKEAQLKEGEPSAYAALRGCCKEEDDGESGDEIALYGR